MAIYSLGDKSPHAFMHDSKSFYIAKNAVVIGDVTIGDSVGVWFNAVVRGDVEPIVIGNETNIQDGCVLHTDHEFPLIIGDRVTVGHNAVLHGCAISDESIIGMGSVILNGATIGKHCIIGANSLIPQNCDIPDNSLVVGSPGRVIRQVTKAEIKQIKESAQHYVANIGKYIVTLNAAD